MLRHSNVHPLSRFSVYALCPVMSHGVPLRSPTPYLQKETKNMDADIPLPGDVSDSDVDLCEISNQVATQEQKTLT